MRSSDAPVLGAHVSRKAAGRKPTKKAMVTRQRILDAAAAIFARKGYSLTLLSDIAERAGMHLTALYYYYDTKESLVSDLICYVPARTLNALQQTLEALPRESTHRQRLETAFAVYLDSILRDDVYVRADHRIAAQISTKLRKPAIGISQQINEIWRNLLADAVAAGEVRRDMDMTMLRMLMIGSMNWAVEWFRPELSPPQRLSSAMQRLFFEGAAPQNGAATRRRIRSVKSRSAK